MTKEKVQLLEIIDSIVKKASIKQDEDYEKNALSIILSSSTQAANFVSVIEEEFDIEFDDDDINVEFFSSTSKIIELINLRSYKSL